MSIATTSLAEPTMGWHDETDADPSELVAMAVHDMKTPLAALRQALQLVAGGRAGAVAEPQARFLAMAMDNAQVLGSLLDRLQGTIGGRSSADDLRPQRLDPAEVAAFVVRALQPSAEVRGVSLEMRCSAGLEDAWADPVLVRRVLINLVANALKYAGKGGIATVIVERLPEDGRLIALRVRDRGPGIPPSDHELVFAARRRSESTCGGQEGAGLGLAIVRDIARAHGGHAWVTNNSGSGCTFTVTLPAFGSGSGAAAQVGLAASGRPPLIELVALNARSGCAARLADSLAGRLPPQWRLLDLGAGRLGLLHAATGKVPGVTVASMLGADLDLVEAEGWAAARVAELQPERLIDAACAAMQPLEPTTARLPGGR